MKDDKTTPDRMVSRHDAMDFATAVAHASGWIEEDEGDDLECCECRQCRVPASTTPDLTVKDTHTPDADAEDLARAVSNWCAPDLDVIEAAYVPVEYVEVRIYLTVAEAKTWVNSDLPPWWVSTTVDQVLRKAMAIS